MEAKRTTLTHALRDGQLEHVVVVQGKQAQSHSTLKAAMCALALAMALTGCQTMERYPKTTLFIAASIALSAPGIFSHGRSHSEVTGEFPMSSPLTLPHDVTTQPVTCNGSNCQ